MTRPVPGAGPPRAARSRTLARWTGELAVVVTGILIAFALNAAWDRRADAAREQAHLRALADDFEENAERLRALIETEERISASSAALLDLSRHGGPLPVDSVQRLFAGVFNSARYDPVMGAYEAVVNSGGLTLIRDDTIRTQLARFAARVGGRYYERFSDEVYLSLIREFAGRLRFYDGLPDSPPGAETFEPLLRDSKFRDYLALRHLAGRDVARSYRSLLRDAEELLERLRSRIR